MRGVGRLRLQRAGHDLLDAIVADLAWRAASGLVVETVEPVLGEALTPGLDSLSRHADRLRDPAVVEPISCPQYDLGSQRIGTRDLATTDATLQHATLLLAQTDPACHRPRPRIMSLRTQNQRNEHVARNFWNRTLAVLRRCWWRRRNTLRYCALRSTVALSE